MQSQAWNGKYAIVVVTDTAVHADADNLSSIGASAIAMLIGPRAPLVLAAERVSFIKHAWDFYRPIGWHNNDVIVDMDVATDQFEEALLWCQKSLGERIGSRNLLSEYDFVAFHCNAPYHAKRSLRIMNEAINDGDKLNNREHDNFYECYVRQGTSISAQNVR